MAPAYLLRLPRAAPCRLFVDAMLKKGAFVKGLRDVMHVKPKGFCLGPGLRGLFGSSLRGFSWM